MSPSPKRIKLDTSQLKPSQVKSSSNIFGDINEEVSSEASDDIAEDQLIEDDDVDENELDEYEVSSSSEDEHVDEDDNKQIDDDKARRKKNDPADFATAMSKILGSNLTSTNRKNPILARSLESKKLDEADADEKLTIKARRQLLAEKKERLEKNHNATVIGTTDAEQAEIIERERHLRKTAQRGVVKLFNAIHASQAASRPVKAGAGVKKREAQAAETSKSVFLQMIKG